MVHNRCKYYVSIKEDCNRRPNGLRDPDLQTKKIQMCGVGDLKQCEQMHRQLPPAESNVRCIEDHHVRRPMKCGSSLHGTCTVEAVLVSQALVNPN